MTEQKCIREFEHLKNLHIAEEKSTALLKKIERNNLKLIAATQMLILLAQIMLYKARARQE